MALWCCDVLIERKMKRTVLQMLLTAAEKYPNTRYLNEKSDAGWVGKTYPEVAAESDVLAMGLMALGIERSDKISLLSEGRSQWVIAEFGIIKAAATVVPLSIKLLPEEVAFRVNHSESKAIVVSANVAEKVLAAWKLIENKGLKIIYLDSNREHIERLAAKYEVPLADLLWLYADVLALGNEKRAVFSAKLTELAETIAEDDVVTISYTSGTTGNPKGIMLSHLNYFANSHDAVEHFQIATGLRTLIILPLDHSFAHTVGIYASLVRGLVLHFVDSRGSSMAALKNIPINLKEVNPNFLLTVPALTGNFMNKIREGIAAKGGFVSWLFNAGLEAGIRINRDGFRKASMFTRLRLKPLHWLANTLIFPKVRGIFGDSLQYCVGGGALLDVKQQHFYYSLGIPVYQGYGLSEAAPIISANTPVIHKMGSSGMVLPTVDCRIKDDKGADLPAGTKGEIVIQGLNVMRGYYKNEKASAETVRDNWLFTGDLGFYDADGFLIVTGREKALLISQDGEKYSPEGIEEAIMNCSDIINQAMIYNDHSRFTSAVITLNNPAVERYIKQHGIEQADVLIEALRDELHRFRHTDAYRDQFPDKWIPSTFAILEEPFTEQNLMINSTMKMVRYKIVETYRNKIDYMYTPEGAQNKNEMNRELLRKMFKLQ